MVPSNFCQTRKKYKKFLLVYNPVEGRVKAYRRLQAVVKSLYKRNCLFEIIESKDLEKRTDLKKFDCIVAVGGDGTVLSAVAVAKKADVSLGIIPCGTANLFASGLNIPTNIHKAIDIIFEGETSKVDLGFAGGQYFALRVGLGYDAKIITDATTFLKDKMGFAAYVIQGVKNAFCHTLQKAKITIDGKTLEVDASSIIVANAGNIFRNMVKIAPQSAIDDGKFDVFIMTSKSFIECTKVLLQVLFGRYATNSSVIYSKGSNIKIETAQTNTHIDGEPQRASYLDIRVIPRALKVLVPAPPPTPVLEKVY